MSTWEPAPEPEFEPALEPAPEPESEISQHNKMIMHLESHELWEIDPLHYEYPFKYYNDEIHLAKCYPFEPEPSVMNEIIPDLEPEGTYTRYELLPFKHNIDGIMITDASFSLHLFWNFNNTEGIRISRTMGRPREGLGEQLPHEPIEYTYENILEDPGTTNNWLKTKGKDKNPMITGLDWDTEYFFYFFKIKKNIDNSENTVSNLDILYVFKENMEDRRARDKCTIIPLNTLENSLEPNKTTVPLTQRFSRIVKGGNIMKVCQNWRPPTWDKIKNDYTFEE
uniref:Uncharacterized protein n=1 Tax=uncultured marine group II/III euryarchaeote AD1000_88_G11 TaxID=1457822 RepID=A0A075G0L4_9EURY|nr:hypothetical protein [uncultured marine group II/III euryarchaeote AD1000_88_G11]